MTRKIEIAPSLLAARFDKLGDEVHAVAAAGADYLHFDVMDGHFVPNLTMGPAFVKASRPLTPLPFDVHLMVTNPSDWFATFIEAGANMISFHAEVTSHFDQYIQEIKAGGAKAGIALKPDTPLESIMPVLPKLDYVLVMTVNPGFAGQKFMPEPLEKIKALRTHIDEKKLPCKIQVDGGINRETAKKVIEAGADILVAGMAVFGHSLDMYEDEIKALRGA